jgi:hypothetical protein
MKNGLRFVWSEQEGEGKETGAEAEAEGSVDRRDSERYRTAAPENV